MKRMLCILTLSLLLMQGFALALSGNDYPAYDGRTPVQNALAGSIAGADMVLEFDPSADYSNIDSGYLQACFFAYDAAQQNYIELYLFLPEAVAAGDIIDAQTAAENGVDLVCAGLYEVCENGDETEYLAGQIANAVYPVGSSYSIAIDAAETNGREITVSGRLNATLVDTAGIAPNVIISAAQFHFTMPAGNAPIVPPIPANPDNAPVDSIKV